MDRNMPPSAPSVTFDEWIARINDACGRLSAQPDAERFKGHLVARQSSALRLSMVDAAGVVLLRTHADMRAGGDGYFYGVLQMRGSAGVEQDDGSGLLQAGDLALMDSNRPFKVSMGDGSRQLSLILPRAVVERGLSTGRIACARRIPASTPLAGLARGLMLSAFREARSALAPHDSEAMLDAVVSLLRPALAVVEPASPSSERLFRKACDFIDAELARDDLTPELIARAIGVSVRGLYRAFAARGLVVGQHIRHRRLDRCADELRSGGASAAKLSAVGYSWGFADPSHFSAAFKARFGVSPSDYRARYAA
jgi:AraC family transcriptional activator of tynA and feaB